jgi:hypothetical protein
MALLIALGLGLKKLTILADHDSAGACFDGDEWGRLAVSFQEVVPSRREGEADVAKRHLPHQGREQPCIRMLV